jgi:hypothetical protein
MSKPDTKTTILAFAAITKLTPAEQIELYRVNVVKPFGGLAKAKDAIVGALHNAMKVTASLKRIYAERLLKREIPPDTTEKKFFEGNGGDVPARVKQLATFFNAMCLTLQQGKPLVAENVLDAHLPSTLEAAAVIISTERKNLAEGWMNTDLTLDVMNALTSAGDAGKKLRDIRKRQLGTKETEAVSVTPAQAIAVLLTAIKGCQDNDPGYDLFAGCQKLADAWGDTSMDPETLMAWQDKYAKAQEEGVAPHVEVVTAAKETAGAAAN